ncbi:uncharacterized protein LOC128652489 [Bombina bombina]|uniref:uncharacterized protein LOC128652489 n=1 Tax=Bombina bombina TaxID=8345 RepID=UPI00235AD077|nr:uncharacterized protein LOC128652489 [Bombina bombina]
MIIFMVVESSKPPVPVIRLFFEIISDAVSAQGPTKKDIESCKKRFNDIKRQTKGKIAKEKQYARGTGGGQPYVADLTDFERKVLQRLGTEVIEGITDDSDHDIRGGSVRTSTSASVNTPSTSIGQLPRPSTSHQIENMNIRQQPQHGQYIRSTTNTSHSLSSADTIPDVRSSTPDTGVGRSSADVGRLFRAMMTDSAPLFDDIVEEDVSSRVFILNLVPVRAHSPEVISPDCRSLTPDLSQMAQDQDFDIHEPVRNPSNDDENPNSPHDVVQEPAIEPFEPAPAKPILQEQLFESL